jgi:hypothetical protein
MRLKTSTGVFADVAPDEVLRAAGVIYQARRRTHGHPPLRAYRCHWCDAEVRGRNALENHERACDRFPSGDLVGVTEQDMAALVWTPPDDA